MEFEPIMALNPSCREYECVCPKCAGECWRDDVDVGVGVIFGPWGCPGCGWSSDPEYDVSDGKKYRDGGEINQWGHLFPSTKKEY